MRKRCNKLKYMNLIVVMLTHNDPVANSLIQAQFNTWIKRVGRGLDLVIVTDVHDERLDEEIAPIEKYPWLNIHIYRSDAPHESNRARAKVLDAFFYVQNKYKDDHQKLYIIKADPDSFILPHALIRELQYE